MKKSVQTKKPKKPKKKPRKQREVPLTPQEKHIVETVSCIQAYLQDRAALEGVAFELSFDFLLDAYLEHPSHMFGVQLCQCCGDIAGDTQEPYPGYFEKWMMGELKPDVKPELTN